MLKCYDNIKDEIGGIWRSNRSRKRLMECLTGSNTSTTSHIYMGGIILKEIGIWCQVVIINILAEKRANARLFFIRLKKFRLQ